MIVKKKKKWILHYFPRIPWSPNGTLIDTIILIRIVLDDFFLHHWKERYSLLQNFVINFSVISISSASMFIYVEQTLLSEFIINNFLSKQLNNKQKILKMQF